MFVLRRAIESLSPSPSCSLASALKVTVCTHRHWLSLYFSLSFSLFFFPPLPSPISLWPSVSHFKTPLKERKKKDWGTGKRRWKKRNRIRQKKGNKDRNVKIFTIIPSEFLSGNINPFNIRLVTVSYCVRALTAKLWPCSKLFQYELQRSLLLCGLCDLFTVLQLFMSKRFLPQLWHIKLAWHSYKKSLKYLSRIQTTAQINSQCATVQIVKNKRL